AASGPADAMRQLFPAGVVASLSAAAEGLKTTLPGLVDRLQRGDGAAFAAARHVLEPAQMDEVVSRLGLATPEIQDLPYGAGADEIIRKSPYIADAIRETGATPAELSVGHGFWPGQAGTEPESGRSTTFVFVGAPDAADTWRRGPWSMETSRKRWPFTTTR